MPCTFFKSNLTGTCCSGLSTWCGHVVGWLTLLVNVPPTNSNVQQFDSLVLRVYVQISARSSLVFLTVRSHTLYTSVHCDIHDLICEASYISINDPSFCFRSSLTFRIQVVVDITPVFIFPAFVIVPAVIIDNYLLNTCLLLLTGTSRYSRV